MNENEQAYRDRLDRTMRAGILTQGPAQYAAFAEGQRANQAGSEGSAAFINYLKNPQMEAPQQAMRGANLAVDPSGYGPDVRGVPVMMPPKMAPLSLQTVASSIYKNNPNISPEGFISALEKFQPQFAQQDKLQLAQLKSQQSASSGGLDKQIYNHALSSGKTHEQAVEEAKAYKRANPTEVGEATKAKESAKGNISPQEEVATGKSQITDVANEIYGIYDNLEKLGGVVSTGQSPGKNISAYMANTGAGQVIGGMLGTKAQSLRDQIAQSRPLLINAIRKSTGMGAKAMDSNTELQFYLSAATDPTRGVQANRAALNRIVELYGIGGKSPENGGTPEQQNSTGSTAPTMQTLDFSQLAD